MPRACTVCGHPQRHEIEQAMLARQPFRAIAGRFALSRTALMRHFDDHLPAAVMQAARAAEIGRGDDLVGRLLELNRETKEILVRAKEAGNDDLALRAIARAERQIELQGKLIGELREAPVVNIVLSPQWMSLQVLILSALDPHPAAKAAVVRALEHAH